MGSKGNNGYFEVLYKTPALESLILTKPSEQDIMKESRKQGMITIKEDGLIKMLNGFVSFDEFMKFKNGKVRLDSQGETLPLRLWFLKIQMLSY